MTRNFQPSRIIFFNVFFFNIFKVNQFLDCFIILLHLVFSLLHIKPFLVPYAYVSTKSIDCILLSTFELKAVLLLISSVKILCLSLLNLCCVFNINLLFFYEFFIIFFKAIYVNFIFFLVVYFIFKLICI